MSKLTSAFVFTLTAALSLLPSAANAQAARAPTPQEVAHARTTGPCTDPWVSIALTLHRLGTYSTGSNTAYIAGVGEFGQCNHGMYNNGSWSSFDELHRAVETAFANMSGNVNITIIALTGSTAKITFDAGPGFFATQTVQLIGHDGASVVSHDGGSIVASGGGNFKVQSTSTEKRINLGKSVLIITKK